MVDGGEIEKKDEEAIGAEEEFSDNSAEYDNDGGEEELEGESHSEVMPFPDLFSFILHLEKCGRVARFASGVVPCFMCLLPLPLLLSGSACLLV